MRSAHALKPRQHWSELRLRTCSSSLRRPNGLRKQRQGRRQQHKCSSCRRPCGCACAAMCMHDGFLSADSFPLPTPLLKDQVSPLISPRFGSTGPCQDYNV